jgi:hypothetical protein
MRVQMQDHLDHRRAIAPKFGQRGCDRFEPFAPAFPTMACHENARSTALPQPGRRQSGLDLKDRVDARIAGDVYLSGDLLRRFAAAVWVGAKRRSLPASMAARYSSSGQGSSGSCVRSPASTCATGMAAVKACQRRTEGARRISLDDEEVRRVAQQRQQRGGHVADMRLRVGPARPAKLHLKECCEAEICEIQVRVLARDDEHGGKATRCERMRDGRQLDRFRPGADHQPYIGTVQPSP